jgi:two-component system, OmpR family, response regulator
MKGLRILIVDDEPELVQALVERLTLRKLNVRGVTRGEEALELVKSETFDVALLDVKMPGLGGIELVKRIHEVCPDLQVVMLTGHGSTQDVEDGKALGVYEYLMKPIKLDSLLDVLREAASTDKDS